MIEIDYKPEYTQRKRATTGSPLVYGHPPVNVNGYKALANAIILQAVKDYREHPEMRVEIERFFLGQYFETLTDIDGTYLLNKLKEGGGIMTKEVAKKWINKLYARADITDEYGDIEDMQPYEEAVNMAIQALEQDCDKCEVGNPCLYCKHKFENVGRR